MDSTTELTADVYWNTEDPSTYGWAYRIHDDGSPHGGMSGTLRLASSDDYGLMVACEELCRLFGGQVVEVHGYSRQTERKVIVYRRPDDWRWV